MQSGYRRDRDAGAKALKIAIKNSKKDKVLFGAVIKAESVFSSLTTQAPPPPPATPQVSTTQAPPPPPATPPPTVSSSMATTASTTSRSSAASRGLPPNPIMAALQQGATALRSTIAPRNVPETPATNQPTPPTSGLVITTDLLSQLRGKLKPTKTTELSPSQRADLVARTPLRPVQSISPISTGAIPILETSSGETTPILSPTSTTGTSETLPPLATITETLKPAKGSPTASSQAPTDTSTIQPDLPSEEAPPAKEATPAELLDPRGEKIQSKARELFNMYQAERAKFDLKATKQLTIVPFRVDGNQSNDRMRVKLENTKEGTRLRFELKRQGAIMDQSKIAPNMRIDILTSIENAIDAINDGRININRRTGEMSGLGVADIKSQRVVFRSRKSGNDDLTRNQIYVMEPQLMRGHLRAYNRSGRPAISRSNISPAFARIVQDIVERNTFEPDDYSSLEAKESADANQFISLTKPIQPRNIDRLSNADTVWQLKKRYEVLVGQLSSGNTGKLVRDEMESILRTLIRLHAMNKDKGLSLIRALREF